MNTFCTDTVIVWYTIGKLINVIKVVVPIIIVFYGTLDIGKAVIAGNDKEIKSCQKMFIKRLIYGIAIFFLPVIVKTVYSLADNNLLENDSKVCFECATKVNSKECSKYLVNNDK